jgi:hypothetical protein
MERFSVFLEPAFIKKILLECRVFIYSPKIRQAPPNAAFINCNNYFIIRFPGHGPVQRPGS